MLPLPRPLLTSLLEQQLRYPDRPAQTGGSGIYLFAQHTELQLVIHRQTRLLVGFFFYSAALRSPTTSQKAAPPPPTDRPTVFLTPVTDNPSYNDGSLSPSSCLYYQSDRPGC